MEIVIVMMVMSSFYLADVLGEYDGYRNTRWGFVILPLYCLLIFGLLWLSETNGWLLWK